MLVDTHAHLFWHDFQQDLEEVLARARRVGVKKIIVPGVDEKSSRAAVRLAKKYPGVIYAAVGIHPTSVGEKGGEEIGTIERLIQQEGDWVVAIGEVGLDLSKEKWRQNLDKQVEVFRQMIKWGLKYNLPLIIHSRQGLEEILSLVDEYRGVRGVFHCFSESETELEEVLRRGFYVSFCGNITWSKRVARLVKIPPRERLLIETDSPFMAPDHLRNEPKNARMLAGWYIKLRGEEKAILEEAIRKNTKELFGI